MEWTGGVRKGFMEIQDALFTLYLEDSESRAASVDIWRGITFDNWGGNIIALK